MNSIFKANDIRGIYPSELNEKEVKKIGYALANYFGPGATIIVGHDARQSSPSLYKALKSSLKLENQKLSGAKSAFGGLKVIEAGLMTTPMLYFLVGKKGAKGGIMITASHNPKQYNGLKIVGAEARPIGGREIEELISEYPLP